jgi:hypothetical protein
MALTGEPELVSFDTAEALDRARDVCGDGVQSLTEFSKDEYDSAFVHEDVVEMYREGAHLRDHYGRVLDHLHMDSWSGTPTRTPCSPTRGRSPRW